MPKTHNDVEHPDPPSQVALQASQAAHPTFGEPQPICLWDLSSFQSGTILYRATPQQRSAI